MIPVRGSWGSDLAVSSNPASLFRHVLQNVANANPLPDARIDIDAMTAWWIYCEANNFEFNMIRDFPSSVWETLTDIALAGRASPVQVDGKWSVIIDQAQTIPTQHFTSRNSSNFEAEKIFVDIPHGFRIRFANREKDWTIDELIVYDDGYDETNATKFEQLDAVGMTDPGHVWKHGRYNLAQIRLRAERWAFTADFEHIVCKRGDLILITHDVLLVGKAAGRVTAVQVDGSNNATGITVDEIFTMEAAKTYGVSIRTVGDVAVARALNLNIGDQTTVVFDAVVAAPHGIAVGDLVGFGEFGSETIDGLVTSIEPESDLVARITAVPYAAAVYTSDTGTIPPFDSKISSPRILPDVVIREVRTDESVIRVGINNTLIPRISIRFDPIVNRPDAIIVAEIRLTGVGADFEQALLTYQSAVEVILEGISISNTYDIRLRWADPTKIIHQFSTNWTVTNNIFVIGISTPPPALENLSIAIGGGYALIQWDLPEVLDVLYGGRVQFRHSHEPNSFDASWGKSVSIGRISKAADTSVILPLKAGTYLAKVIDSGGKQGAVSKIEVNQASVLTYGNVDSIAEEPSFSGVHNNTVVVGGYLKLTTDGLWDDIVDVDLEADIDLAGTAVGGGIISEGTYSFAFGIDLTTVKKVRLTTVINALVANEYDLVDDRLDNIDSWDDFDGTDSGSADARIQVRYTDDDPDVSPSWSTWRNLDSAEFDSRGFGFRAKLFSSDAAFNILISKLQIIAEEVV